MLKYVAESFAKKLLSRTQEKVTVLVKTCKSNVFLKNHIFAKAKQTFLQAEMYQIIARKICVSCGFWIHIIGACWQVFSFFLFRAGASAWISFLLEMGMQTHISPLPALHIRGEDLWSLNTTSWGWSLWQHSMRHRLFQCGNWFLQPCVHASTAWPFQQCIQRCSTTRHLCSVATCSGRSTRNDKER